MNENQFLDNVKLSSLNDIDRQKYKLFLMHLIKLSRDTKRIKNEKPTINNIELPHLIIIDNIGISNIFTFSIKENTWMLKIENVPNQQKYNPTAISGIIKKLNNFDLKQIEIGIELYQEEINELSLKYGITYK